MPLTTAPPTTSVPNPASQLVVETHMTPQQRNALQTAHSNSVGYFITQDSSFGNVILPVLPRFIEK
ncbi:hypothetical protein LOTGIDRAFT_142417 [Lottia gigantea]|uniref:SOSS complex subunit C n=1 Tax=Lottia gigantea TaxID=225164 RepID=V4AYG6_LOTGI|nr:hypothetical protein LOTGIDRAFT_142417 [Lottia gigantea]ESO98691.1 hypothetical protein LOTGIDRAFT_142417 [Lottia gigantea]